MSKKVKQVLNLDRGEIIDALIEFYGLPEESSVNFDVTESGRYGDITTFQGIEFSYLKDFDPPNKSGAKFGFGKDSGE